MTYIGVDAHSMFLVATTLRDDKKSRVRVDLENLEFWAAGWLWQTKRGSWALLVHRA